MGQGLVYEAMNMAALWKLPVIYVCENNRYTEYTYFEEVMAGNLRDRPAAFGIPVEEVDGQDIRHVVAAAQRAVARARQGQGPASLSVIHTVIMAITSAISTGAITGQKKKKNTGRPNTTP